FKWFKMTKDSAYIQKYITVEMRQQAKLQLAQSKPTKQKTLPKKQFNPLYFLKPEYLVHS
nr:hypothetical protein [Chitinophagaceae bacterium]